MSEAVAVARQPGVTTHTGRRVWLIGPGPAAERAAEALVRAADLPHERATLDEVLASAEPGDWALLAGLGPADAVLAIEALIQRGASIALDVSDEPVLHRALGTRRWGLDCIVMTPAPPSAVEGLAFRLRDIFAAGVGLLGCAPLLGIAAVLIKRSSPGPVFFATEVVGKDGRTFIWRKLRTMKVGTPSDERWRREAYRAFLAQQSAPVADASIDTNAPRKVIDTSRVTGVGRVLRRHSLDELPQLWNVLKGEMTLVGPRPCLPYEYELQSPWHRLRYRVRPGLTGPWQAYGRSTLTFDQMALLDYCYGRVKSFCLDARLVLRTAVVVLTGEGAK